MKNDTGFMTETEKRVIRAFARGESGLKDEAIIIHRKYLSEVASPEQRFMGEVDTPCPDLMLRGQYRKELLK